jgi:hypothetical protein
MTSRFIFSLVFGIYVSVDNEVPRAKTSQQDAYLLQTCRCWRICDESALSVNAKPSQIIYSARGFAGKAKRSCAADTRRMLNDCKFVPTEGVRGER